MYGFIVDNSEPCLFKLFCYFFTHSDSVTAFVRCARDKRVVIKISRIWLVAFCGVGVHYKNFLFSVSFKSEFGELIAFLHQNGIVHIGYVLHLRSADKRKISVTALSAKAQSCYFSAFVFKSVGVRERTLRAVFF